MKYIKISLLLILAASALLLTTGCRCVPSSEDWYFHSYKQEMTFIGGVKLELGFSDASETYPFAEAANENIGISFSKDGNVVFTDVDGITHRGTYTYEHVKRNYTNFTITLENGETVEGSSMKSGKSSKLSLTYKDVVYNFSTENNRSGVTTYDVVQAIYDGELGELHEAKVIKTESGFSVQFSDYISYPIKEGTAVYAIQINSDGSYEVLDAIVDGEVLSTYNNSADYIVLYYVAD